MYVPSQLPLHHFQTIFLHYVLFFRELFCSMIYSLPLRLLFSYLLSCPVTHAVLYCPLLHLTISLSYVSFTTCSPKSCILFVFHIYIYPFILSGSFTSSDTPSFGMIFTWHCEGCGLSNIYILKRPVIFGWKTPRRAFSITGAFSVYITLIYNAHTVVKSHWWYIARLNA